jgi:hypothetical protein
VLGLRPPTPSLLDLRSAAAAAALADGLLSVLALRPALLLLVLCVLCASGRTRTSPLRLSEAGPDTGSRSLQHATQQYVSRRVTMCCRGYEPYPSNYCIVFYWTSCIMSTPAVFPSSMHPPPGAQHLPHLTTQMLWRSLKLQLLTPRSGIGVDGPPTRLGAGLAQADVGRGRPAPLAALTVPLLLLLLLAPAAKDLRRG